MGIERIRVAMVKRLHLSQGPSETICAVDLPGWPTRNKRSCPTTRNLLRNPLLPTSASINFKCRLPPLPPPDRDQEKPPVVSRRGFPDRRGSDDQDQKLR